MAYLEVSAFKKLKAFFWALQKSNFNLNKIPFRDNEGTPVDRAYCLALLRSFPDFQAEAFKDDNFLIKYLSKPGNISHILHQFTPAQQMELMTVLEEKPIAVEAAGEQPTSGQEQPVPIPTGEPAQTMATPGLPSTLSTPSRRAARVIYNIPQPPQPSKGEISIANSSGVVKEAGDPSKLVTANKSGVVVEKPPSKIFIADKGGKVVGEHPILAKTGPPVDNVPKQELARGIKGGGTIKLPYQATDVAKNLGSSAQIFMKKAGSRLASSLATFLKGAAGAGGSFLGGLAGGGSRLLARIGMGGAEAIASIGTQMTRGGLSLAGLPKKVWVGGLVFFMLFFGLATSTSLPGQPTPTSQAAPVGGGPSYTGGGTSTVSCPFNNGVISCGSQFSGHPVCNHCDAVTYAPYACPVGADTGRDTAIDVVSPDKLVFLPYIEGASVQWTIDEVGTAIPISEGGGGIAVAATAKMAEKTYRIRFVHIASTNLKLNNQIPSGTLIGQYISSASHTHITIQENGEFKPADTYFKLCSK